eukprot:scaffold41073_cov63-Phaeocystis_antarctica.AAC.6
MVRSSSPVNFASLLIRSCRSATSLFGASFASCGSTAPLSSIASSLGRIFPAVMCFGVNLPSLACSARCATTTCATPSSKQHHPLSSYGRLLYASKMTACSSSTTIIGARSVRGIRRDNSREI